MTSSIPFGRRGLSAPATWPSAPAPPRDESNAATPRPARPTSSAGKARSGESESGAIVALAKLLFSFEGRIRRTQYWLAWIAVEAIVWGLFMGVVLAVAGPTSITELTRSPAFLILSLLLWWIELALQIKRWHDRDKSWLWMFIGFIPIAGPIWVFIECGFLDGTPGANRFGPSPKGLSGGGVADKDLSAYGIY